MKIDIGQVELGLRSHKIRNILAWRVLMNMRAWIRSTKNKKLRYQFTENVLRIASMPSGEIPKKYEEWGEVQVISGFGGEPATVSLPGFPFGKEVMEETEPVYLSYVFDESDRETGSVVFTFSLPVLLSLASAENLTCLTQDQEEEGSLADIASALRVRRR